MWPKYSSHCRVAVEGRYICINMKIYKAQVSKSIIEGIEITQLKLYNMLVECQGKLWKQNQLGEEVDDGHFQLGMDEEMNRSVWRLFSKAPTRQATPCRLYRSCLVNAWYFSER